jgi:GTP-binding protein
MLPVIAIVGRPNVGKSTLFNGITKSREALVADVSGVTRDRHYGTGHFEDKSFIVVDTGGIVEIKDVLAEAIKKQALLAMSEADAIVFVVDAKAGLTYEDLAIAKLLKNQGKKVCLVINKIDGTDETTVKSDFYSLGLGEPFLLSALHRRGIQGLLKQVTATFPAQVFQEQTSDEENPAPRIPRVAIIGKPNVGKSTLINRLLGEERQIVSDIAGTTRDSIEITLEREGKPYIFIDTAGIRKKGRIEEALEKFSVIKALQAIESAHVVLYVIDAKTGVTDQDLHLLGFVLHQGRSLILAFNKWDGLSLEQKRAIEDDLERRLNFVDFAKKHFISALHGTGVGLLFKSIDATYHAAFKPMTTKRVTDLLLAATQQLPPPVSGRQRIKLRYANPGGHNPPIIVIHGNNTADLPKSYQRYLVNFYREALRLVGTPLTLIFKTGENPFKDKKNMPTDRQLQKRKRAKKMFKK